MGSGLGALVRALGDFVFPPACPTCGAPPDPAGPFCPDCREAVEFLGDDICPRCGAPWREPSGRGLCFSCRQKPPAYDQARSLAPHRGPLAEAVRAFKYQRRWEVGAALARFLAEAVPARWLDGADLIAPTPLHPWRLMTRGFNQAQVLARPLGRGPDGPRLVPRLLARRRYTRPQTGLSAAERLANVEGAFTVRGPERARARDRRVLLVDDVFTTGATAGQCALALKEAGAAWVGVITLTRAVGGGA